MIGNDNGNGNGERMYPEPDTDAHDKIYSPHRLTDKAIAKLNELCDRLLKDKWVSRWELKQILSGMASHPKLSRTEYCKGYGPPMVECPKCSGTDDDCDLCHGFKTVEENDAKMYIDGTRNEQQRKTSGVSI